jgi:hypothetical protein
VATWTTKSRSENSSSPAKRGGAGKVIALLQLAPLE